MRGITRHTCIAMFAFLLVGAHATAQQTHCFEVSQGRLRSMASADAASQDMCVDAGAQIRVATHARTTYTGALAGVRDSSLVIEAADGAVTIITSDIDTLWVRSHDTSRRAKQLGLRGALAGAAATGAIIGALLYFCGDDCSAADGDNVVGWLRATAVGGVAGGLLGFAVGLVGDLLFPAWVQHFP
jgi:hypothetical protein